MLTRSEFDSLLIDLRERRSGFEDIEAKAACQGTPERLYETMSSFANRSGGGTIIFGIDNYTLEPVGVGNPDQLQRDVAAVASEMEPPLRISMQPFLVDGKVILVVQVPEVAPEAKPCYYRPAGLYAGAYVRVGDGDRRMTEYDIHTYLVARGPVVDDRAPVPDASVDDLSPDLIAGYLARLRTEKPEATYLRQADERSLLKTLGILTAVGDRDVPTLAGLIAFGRYPQQYFPNLAIALTIQADHGATVNDRLLGNFKAEGPAQSMLEQALSWLGRNLRRKTVVTGLLHQDIPEYPLEALREALVNAVVHRDYSRYAVGTQVQVRLYPDRIEITNPGGLFGPVTVDHLGEPGVQSTRNSVLARIFEDLGLMENRGSGIRTMLDAMRQAHLGPPQFDDSRIAFKVTFHNETLLTQDALKWLEQFASVQGLNDRERYALIYLRSRGRIANRDYQLLNSVDAHQAARELRELVEAGLVVPYGVRRGTFYRLAPEGDKPGHLPGKLTLRETAAPQLTSTQSAVLELIRRKGPIGAASVSHELGIKRQTANAAIRALLDAGLIRMTQPGRRARNQSYVSAE